MNNPKLKKIADVRKAIKAAHTLEEKRGLLIDFVSKYFTLENRATKNDTLFSGSCTYFSKKHRGCAIGLFLSPKTAKYLDTEFNNNSGIFEILHSSRRGRRIPKWLVNLGASFLSSIQSLHDESFYWTNDGLSERGVARVQTIKNQYATVH